MSEREISEFKFTPKADKKQVFPMLFLALAVGGVLVILSVSSPLYKGVISFFAAISLTAAVYYYTRYIAETTSYSVIINSNNEPMFLVNKTVGKRSNLAFMTHVSGIVSIQKFTKSGENKYIRDSQTRKYNFTVTYGLNEFYVLKSKSNSESCEVLLECTDEVARRLLEYAEIAKLIAEESE